MCAHRRVRYTVDGSIEYSTAVVQHNRGVDHERNSILTITVGSMILRISYTVDSKTNC
jgi:hypothetical protein